MKIEAGKYYRTRDGRKVGPMNENTSGMYSESHPWRTPSGATYADDGKYDIFAYPSCSEDIIAEWIDEPATGTLAELNVKPGDVVEWVSGSDKIAHTVVRVDGAKVYLIENNDEYKYVFDWPITSSRGSWHIISRASHSTTPPTDVATPDVATPLTHTTTPQRTVTTHGTWTPYGPKPKTQYVYSLTFDLDTEGHPIWSSAKVSGR